MKILEVNVQKQSKFQKTKVYFFQQGETISENLANRYSRECTLYRKELLPLVIEQLKHSHPTLKDCKFNWSQRAGCSCGCSPGFIANHEFGYNIYVTYSY